MSNRIATTRNATLPAALTAAGVAAMVYAVRSPRSDFFGPSVWRGAPDRRSVALTFDDGPSEGTLQILEALDEHAVPATFFQCGVNVERFRDVARHVRAAGHEIGNHSHTHPLLSLRSASFIEEEFRRAQHVIEDVTGFAPVLLRAPFGVRWFGFRRMQKRLNLLGVMWTVIGYDWKRPCGSIVDRLMRGVGNGAIICLHDGRKLQPNPEIGETVQAVRRLIPLLREQGFSFETVSQILCPTN